MRAPRIQITSVEAAKFLSFAKNKLSNLIRSRELSQRSAAKRVLSVNGFTIELFTCEGYDRIRILGGGAGGDILLAKANGQLFIYDYLSDSLRPAAKVNADVSSLHPFFSRVNHINDGISVTNGSSPVAFESPGGVFVGQDYVYHLDLYLVGETIMAKTDDGLFGLISLNMSGAMFEPGYSCMQGSLFTLTAIANPTDMWNFYTGLIGLGLNAPGRNVSELFRWIPSIFYAEPANGYYTTGWWYGQFGGWLENDEPLDSIEVDFLSLMNCRYASAQRAYGYCECLTTMNGKANGRVSFFLGTDPIPKEPGGRFSYLSGYTYYGGAEMRGYAREFSLDIFPGEKPTIDLWNFKSFLQESILGADDMGLGIVATIGNRAKVYRWRGSTKMLLETDRYHSHSVSPDGRILAVFEQEKGTIDRVHVFDLYGENDIDVRESGVVASATASLGSVIPPQEENVALPGGSAPSIPYDYNDSEMSPLAVMSYPMTSTYGVPSFHNLIITGTHATISDTVDECFDSVIIVDSTYEGGNTHHVESRGTVAGAYSGSPGSVRFQGIGSGIVIDRPDLTISIDGSEYVSVSNALGDVTITGVDEDGYVDHSQVGCNDVVDVCATTTCGQEACEEVESTTPPLTALSGPSPTYLGAVYTATGGVEPYTYSIDKGSIDPDTGEITSTTGMCGPVLVTVVDACGSTRSLYVEGLTGSWRTVLYNSIRYDVRVGTEVQYTVGINRYTFWYYGTGSCPTTGCSIFSDVAFNNGSCPDGINRTYQGCSYLPVSGIGPGGPDCTIAWMYETFGCC